MKCYVQIFSFCILKTFTGIFFVTFALSAVPLQVFGQWQDNFDDGDFTHNPSWSGNNDHFQVVDKQLRLSAPAVAASSYLITQSTHADNCLWEFTVRLQFNPSASNFARIYLTSDQSDLSGALNGYFVMIGNTADEVGLYRQSGTTRTKIIDGIDGVLNVSNVVVRVKVTRIGGEFELFSDVGLTGTYTNEGKVLDETFKNASFVGIQCVYSATRSDKFAFDDFLVDLVDVVDATPPSIQEIVTHTLTTISIRFSEKVDGNAASNPKNYLVSDGIGQPFSATLLEDEQTVLLTFATALANGKSINITVANVADQNGNVMPETTWSFTPFLAIEVVEKDIIINEIMADPSPTVDLPEVEFVECYNRSDKAISLSGYTLSDGTTTSTIGAYLLRPKEYVILTPSASANLFERYGNVIGLSNFPTLNNSGDAVVLRNAQQRIIDSVYYVDTWYRDTEKKQGGWTLELIDPDNICAEGENWIASTAPVGGTPGGKNAVHEYKPDLTGPHVVDAWFSSHTEIEVLFSEKLENNIPTVKSIGVEPALQLLDLVLIRPRLNSFRLILSHPAEEGVLYHLTFNNIFDCAGNQIQTGRNTASVALPQKAIRGDVVINEVLFNPRPGGVDFVELFNCSNKYIDLQNWSVANIDNEKPINAKRITAQHLILKPKEYKVITSDPDILTEQYFRAVRNVMIKAATPTMNDKEGSVGLFTAANELVDGMQYEESMHNILLAKKEGVSLERINPTMPSDNNSTWKSASEHDDFATPGYRNSNTRNDVIPSEAFTVDPEVFLPMYGQPDFTLIRYQNDEPGQMASIRIYDSHGRLVKRIAENTLLGMEGSFRWDGDGDDGHKVRIGSYMVWVEIYTASGASKHIRKRVAIAGKL